MSRVLGLSLGAELLGSISSHVRNLATFIIFYTRFRI
jgi:hypothetical protein